MGARNSSRPHWLQRDARDVSDVLGDVRGQYIGSAIAIYSEARRGRDADLVQQLQAETPIPQDPLHGDIVDTERAPSLYIRDGLVEGEAVRVERYKVVARLDVSMKSDRVITVMSPSPLLPLNTWFFAGCLLWSAWRSRGLIASCGDLAFSSHRETPGNFQP